MSNTRSHITKMDIEKESSRASSNFPGILLIHISVPTRMFLKGQHLSPPPPCRLFPLAVM